MSYKTIVELSDAELDAVTGGTYCGCCCSCPPNGGNPSGGNPGNFKAVGNAGETPSGNSNFIFGGSRIGNNGRAGNSGN